MPDRGRDCASHLPLCPLHGTNEMSLRRRLRALVLFYFPMERRPGRKCPQPWAAAGGRGPAAGRRPTQGGAGGHPSLGREGPGLGFPPCPEAAALSQGLFLGSVEKVATMQALEWAAGAGGWCQAGKSKGPMASSLHRAGCFSKGVPWSPPRGDTWAGGGPAQGGPPAIWPILARPTGDGLPLPVTFSAFANVL